MPCVCRVPLKGIGHLECLRTLYLLEETCVFIPLLNSSLRNRCCDHTAQAQWAGLSMVQTETRVSKPDPESSLCCVTLGKSLPLTGISKVSWLEQLSSYVSPGHSLLCFDE